MANQLFNFLGSLVVLAVVTTMLLPGRQTPQVIGASADGIATMIRAGMGK